MFINTVCKNIIIKLFCCIIVFSIMCQVFAIPGNNVLNNISDENLSAQTDIFSAVFVVEKTINEFTCSVVGNIFNQTTKQQNENKTDNKKIPVNKNDISILSFVNLNKTVNLQTTLFVLLNGFLIDAFYNYRQTVARCIGNMKNFTVYFLEMLLKSASVGRYGDYNITVYNKFFGKPA